MLSSDKQVSCSLGKGSIMEKAPLSGYSGTQCLSETEPQSKQQKTLCSSPQSAAGSCYERTRACEKSSYNIREKKRPKPDSGANPEEHHLAHESPV